MRREEEDHSMSTTVIAVMGARPSPPGTHGLTGKPSLDSGSSGRGELPAGSRATRGDGKRVESTGPSAPWRADRDKQQQREFHRHPNHTKTQPDGHAESPVSNGRTHHQNGKSLNGLTPRSPSAVAANGHYANGRSPEDDRHPAASGPESGPPAGSESAGTVGQRVSPELGLLSSSPWLQELAAEKQVPGLWPLPRPGGNVDRPLSLNSPARATVSPGPSDPAGVQAGMKRSVSSHALLSGLATASPRRRGDGLPARPGFRKRISLDSHGVVVDPGLLQTAMAAAAASVAISGPMLAASTGHAAKDAARSGGSPAAASNVSLRDGSSSSPSASAGDSDAWRADPAASIADRSASSADPASLSADPAASRADLAESSQGSCDRGAASGSWPAAQRGGSQQRGPSAWAGSRSPSNGAAGRGRLNGLLQAPRPQAGSRQSGVGSGVLLGQGPSSHAPHQQRQHRERRPSRTDSPGPSPGSEAQAAPASAAAAADGNRWTHGREPAGSTDLERFLQQVTPMLQLDPSKAPQQALDELSIDAVWSFYAESSIYGREVYTQGGQRGPSLCYFVPYLSAMQLFTPAAAEDSPSPGTSSLYVCDADADPGWPRHMHLRFEHFEHEMPFNRSPLCERIEQLARQHQLAEERPAAEISPEGASSAMPACGETSPPQAPSTSVSPVPGGVEPDGAAGPPKAGPSEASSAPSEQRQLHGSFLRDTRLHELHPSSWFAVAWYPVYRIPDAPLCARFLTFHSFAPIVISMQRAVAALQQGQHRPVAIMPLQVVGLKWYNMQGERWLEAIGGDQDSSSSPAATGASGRRPLAPPPPMDLEWQAHLSELQGTAERLARGHGLHTLGPSGPQEVRLRHPDFEFFDSRS